MSETSVLHLLATIYDGASEVLFGSQDEVELATLAIWSQQWPALRRQFAIRVGSGKAFRRRSKDIGIEIRSGGPRVDAAVNSRWISCAAHDVIKTGGPLRQFLWRYGPEWSPTPETFSALCSVYATLRDADPRATAEALSTSLSILSTQHAIVPEPSLKKHLEVGGIGRASAVPALDAISIAQWLRDRNLDVSTEVLSELRRLSANAWRDRSEDIARLLSGSDDSALADALASTAPCPGTLGLLKPYQQALATLVARRPELLADEFALSFSDSELTRLFSLGPSKESLALLGERLVAIDDSKVVETAWSTDEMLTAKLSLPLLVRGELKYGWARAATRHPDSLIRAGLVDAISSWRELASAFNVVGWSILEADAFPMKEFGLKIAKLREDVHRNERQELMARLIRFAFEHPRPGIEPVFEAVFPELGPAVLRDEASWSVLSQLGLSNGRPSWNYDWFYGPPPRVYRAIKFVEAVKHAYSSLDRNSYARLSSGPARELFGLSHSGG